MSNFGIVEGESKIRRMIYRENLVKIKPRVETGNGEYVRVGDRKHKGDGLNDDVLLAIGKDAEFAYLTMNKEQAIEVAHQLIEAARR